MNNTDQRPKIIVHDINDVDIKDFKFLSKKEFDKKLKRAERIVSIEDPENPNELLNIHMRALTSEEEAKLYKPALSQQSIASLVEAFMAKSEEGEALEPSEITNIVAENIKLDDIDADDDLFYKRLQKAIVKPGGVTIEWLKRRNPVILDTLNDTLDELQAENYKWSMPESDTEGSGDDNE